MVAKSSTEIVVFSLSGVLVWYLVKYVVLYIFESSDPLMDTLRRLPVVHILTLILSILAVIFISLLSSCSANINTAILAVMISSVIALIGSFASFQTKYEARLQHVCKTICKAAYVMMCAVAFVEFPSTVCASVALVTGTTVLVIIEIADLREQ